jgi:hypothetical protein
MAGMFWTLCVQGTSTEESGESAVGQGYCCAKQREIRQGKIVAVYLLTVSLTDIYPLFV